MPNVCITYWVSSNDFVLSILNIIVISILGENLKRNLKNLEMKKS